MFVSSFAQVDAEREGACSETLLAIDRFETWLREHADHRGVELWCDLLNNFSRFVASMGEAARVA